jgi:spore maturation protein CgeB
VTLDLVFLGLSITSSWGNGHATTYRSLVRELARRGHRLTFLERDLAFYASNRDLSEAPWCDIQLYRSLEELRDRFASTVARADVVVVGSYVPEGVAVGTWVTEVSRGITAFYDIDTPVTLAKLATGDHEYLSAALVRRYDLYLSFTGGLTLARLERDWGAARARPLYCSVDPDLYFPTADAPLWDLGYLGTYSADRQPTLDRLLLDVARRWPQGRFAVAGPQYPADVAWLPNVMRASHLPPAEHAAFYNRQRFTLNVTREAMIAAGWSPSVRLFEAAACGTPIISDVWSGIEELFVPGEEILLARDGADVTRYVRSWTEDRRLAVGRRARARVLREHTAAHRAEELENHVEETLSNPAKRRQVTKTRTTTLIERSEP